MFNLFTKYIPIAFLVLLAWSLMAPPEWTPAARIGGLLGVLEREWINARKDAQVAFTQEMAEAEAEVQRRTYATQKATENEANIAQKQIEATSQTQVLDKIIANVAQGACYAGKAMEALSPDGDQVPELKGACDVADDIREAMAKDYAILNGKRTETQRDMMDAYEDAHQEDDQ